MDALGLNILKLDHVKESEKDQQRNDCSRPLWHVGLYIYIASQLVGSTIALSMIINNKMKHIFIFYCYALRLS